MKLKNGWEYRTLAELENVKVEPPPYPTRLVQRCTELMTVPLNRFTVEDLRIMIGQKFSLPYLIPLAVKVLEQNLFAEGDLYEGDLLNAVLSAPHQFWVEHKDHWLTISQLMDGRDAELKENNNKADHFKAVFSHT